MGIQDVAILKSFFLGGGGCPTQEKRGGSVAITVGATNYNYATTYKL